MVILQSVGNKNKTSDTKVYITVLEIPGFLLPVNDAMGVIRIVCSTIQKKNKDCLKSMKVLEMHCFCKTKNSMLLFSRKQLTK